MNYNIKIILSFIITIVFLYIAFKDIDLNNFYVSLKSVKWSFLFILVVMTMLSMLIRTYRWQFLLRVLKAVSYKSVFSFTMIGFMANNVLPAHAGEFIRAFYIGRREKISVVSAFTTIFIERLFDFIAITLFLILILPFVSIPPLIKNIGMVIGLISFISVSIFAVLATNPDNKREFLLKLIYRLPKAISKKAKAFLNSFFDGIEMLRSLKTFLLALAISIILWTQMIATIYILLHGYGLNINLPLASTTVMIFVVFSVLIPSSPGYFGVLQLAFIFSLNFFDIGKSDALACSVIYHLTQYIPITLIGILFLLKEGLSFKEIAMR